MSSPLVRDTAGAPAPSAGPGSEGSDGPVGAAAKASSLEALAAEATAFVGMFERWSSRKAIENGASIPRMKLLYAVHCNGPRKMADLADALDVTPRNVTALVDSLEAEGLVRRVPHATDRRVTLVELTCNSDQVASRFNAYLSSIGGLFENLDEQDRLTMLRLLGSLRAKMRHDDSRTSVTSTPAGAAGAGDTGDTADAGGAGGTPETDR